MMINSKTTFSDGENTKYLYEVLLHPKCKSIDNVCILLDNSRSMGDILDGGTRMDVAKHYMNLIKEWYYDVSYVTFSYTCSSLKAYTGDEEIRTGCATYFEYVAEIVNMHIDAFDLFVLITDGVPTPGHEVVLVDTKHKLLEHGKKMLGYIISNEGSGEVVRDFASPYPICTLMDKKQDIMFLKTIIDVNKMFVAKYQDLYIIGDNNTGVGYFISDQDLWISGPETKQTKFLIDKFAELELMESLLFGNILSDKLISSKSCCVGEPHHEKLARAMSTIECTRTRDALSMAYACAQYCDMPFCSPTLTRQDLSIYTPFMG